MPRWYENFDQALADFLESGGIMYADEDNDNWWWQVCEIEEAVDQGVRPQDLEHVMTEALQLGGLAQEKVEEVVSKWLPSLEAARKSPSFAEAVRIARER